MTIRVLASSEKVVEVRQGMKSRYCDNKEMAETFPYLAKAIFAFEEIDGQDVCFFGMHVQEFGSNAAPPNARYVQAVKNGKMPYCYFHRTRWVFVLFNLVTVPLQAGISGLHGQRQFLQTEVV